MVVTRRQASLQQQSPDSGRTSGQSQQTESAENGIFASHSLHLSSKPANGEAIANRDRSKIHTPTAVYFMILVFIVITITTVPRPFQPTHHEEPTIRHVFFYGWLTAISTGLGVVPFMCMPNGIAPYWVGISNGRSIRHFELKEMGDWTRDTLSASGGCLGS